MSLAKTFAFAAGKIVLGTAASALAITGAFVHGACVAFGDQGDQQGINDLVSGSFGIVGDGFKDLGTGFTELGQKLGLG